MLAKHRAQFENLISQTFLLKIYGQKNKTAGNTVWHFPLIENIHAFAPYVGIIQIRCKGRS